MIRPETKCDNCKKVAYPLLEIQGEKTCYKCLFEELILGYNRMRVVMNALIARSEAYPIAAFPEPSKQDWKDIRKVLDDNGFSLDNISASAMRNVLTYAADLIRKAEEDNLNDGGT